MERIAAYFIDHRATTLTLTLLMLVGGLYSFGQMGRLEDPAFTIKDALVITPYPGATAEEVELEVSNKIEVALQKLGQLDKIKSQSTPGMSIVTATIKDSYDGATLPQVWDELRRKVTDAARELPPARALPSSTTTSATSTASTSPSTATSSATTSSGKS